MKRKDSEIEQSQVLLDNTRSYKTVSKWKIAALVTGILIVAFLVTDILLLVHLNNNQPRKQNYTFAADIISDLASASTTITAKQFGNMMSALTISYDELEYQQGSKVDDWTKGEISQLTLTRVIQFFTTKVEHRLTLVMLSNNNVNYVVGAYTHIPFQIPKNWNDFLVNQNKTYYNFEIDNRQSVLIGGNNPLKYLKMDGSDQNLTNCQVLSLDRSDLTFLQGVNIKLYSADTQGSPYLNFHALTGINDECFTQNSERSFMQRLAEIVGAVNQNVQYSILGIRSYQLEP